MMRCCDNNHHKIATLSLRTRCRGAVAETGPPVGPREMPMTNEFALKPPGRVRGRPFEKGQSGNPAGRRVGCRNMTTIAASLLAGEAQALTRKAVELALLGDPTA